jgi:hypothetical protein
MNEFIQIHQANLSLFENFNQPEIPKFREMFLMELTVVEKSLFEYLETKRMAFPGFYLVLANYLSDILSKGRNPKEIDPHIAKIFYYLVKFAFKDDKTYTSMSSRSKVIVPFDEPVVLGGQVEIWLQKLTACSSVTIRKRNSEVVVQHLIQHNLLDDFMSILVRLVLQQLIFK